MIIGDLIGIGNTARVYQWGENEVIKIFHDNQSAINEAKNAEVISNLKLRAPRFTGLVEVGGQIGIVYEKIDGPTMLWHIAPTEQSISYHAKVMANLQYELHQVDNQLLPNLKPEIKMKINHSQEITEHEKHRIVDELDKLPEGSAICHYDFHPDNIIMSQDGPIIIDWMNVLIGSHEADVARTSMMIQSHSLPPKAPAWLVQREFRMYFHQEYLGEYMKLSGISEKLLDRWMTPTLAVRIDEMKGEFRQEVKEKLQLRLKK